MARRRSTIKRVVTNAITVRTKTRRRRRRLGRPTAGLRRVTECGATYAKCVLAPEAGPSKIPDGSCHSVLIEYTLDITGVPTNGGSLVVAAVPGLPCGIMGVDGNFTGPDREQNIVITNVAAGTTSAALFPYPDFRSGVAAAIAGQVVNYNSGKTAIVSARVVAQKLEVVPTGALIQQGGSAVTARIPLFFQNVPAQYINQTAVGSTAFAGSANQPMQLDGGSPNLITFSGLSAYPDARMCSGTESCVLFSIQPSDDFEPILPSWFDKSNNIGGDTWPWTQTYSTAGNSSTSPPGAWGTTTSLAAAMLPSSATDIAAYGNFWSPPAGVGLMWAGQGLPSGQAYSFRVRTCMELCVNHNTSSYRPFVTPPAERDEMAITLVRDVMAKAPPSVPKAESTPGWWSHLTTAATGIGDMIGALGLPVISPVANVATNLVRRLIGNSA